MFFEKYFRKGTKVLVTGRIQTGSYERDGQRIYTTDVVVEDQEFAESKNAGSSNGGGYQEAAAPAPVSAGDGFMNVPEVIDEDLPFAQPGI